MSRDMIKLRLRQHFCRATRILCRVGVTLCCDFYTFRSCNTCTFSLTTCAVLRQGGHSSQKSWKCPGNLFCLKNVLGDDPFLAIGPGKVLELSNYIFKIYKLKDVFLAGNIFL